MRMSYNNDRQLLDRNMRKWKDVEREPQTSVTCFLSPSSATCVCCRRTALSSAIRPQLKLCHRSPSSLFFPSGSCVSGSPCWSFTRPTKPWLRWPFPTTCCSHCFPPVSRRRAACVCWLPSASVSSGFHIQQIRRIIQHTAIQNGITPKFIWKKSIKLVKSKVVNNNLCWTKIRSQNQSFRLLRPHTDHIFSKFAQHCVFFLRRIKCHRIFSWINVRKKNKRTMCACQQISVR